MRGKRNDPALVRYICGKMAELRGLGEEEMSELTFRNALRFFRMESV